MVEFRHQSTSLFDADYDMFLSLPKIPANTAAASMVVGVRRLYL
jgi:hypothetical protein